MRLEEEIIKVIEVAWSSYTGRKKKKKKHNCLPSLLKLNIKEGKGSINNLREKFL